MSKSKPKPTRKPARTNTISVQFYADAETLAALDRYLESRPDDERPAKRAIWLAGLRAYLQAKGFWSPEKK